MSALATGVRLVTVFAAGAALAMTGERVRVYLRLRRLLPKDVRPLVGHVTLVSAALMGYVGVGMVQVLQRIGRGSNFSWTTPAYLGLEILACVAVAVVTHTERERLEFYEAAMSRRSDANPPDG